MCESIFESIRIRYQIGEKMFAAICRDDNDKPYYITLKLDPLEGDFLRKQYEDEVSEMMFWKKDNLEGKK